MQQPDLLSKLRDLEVLLSRLARALNKAEGLSQDVLWALSRLTSAVELSGAPPLSGRASRAAHAAARSGESGIAQLGRGHGESASEPLASQVEFVRRANGSVKVRLDGGKWFSLSRGLGELLVFLARDDGDSGDALVRWKTRTELLEWMEKSAGRQVRPGTLNKRVHDLKNALERLGGRERALVQSHPALGRRFARRRSPRAPVLDGD